MEPSPYWARPRESVQIGGTRMEHAACWAHARRQFFEAVQLNPRDPVATPIVARMYDLFAVDGEARRIGIGLTWRHALRQERAKPPLEDIRSKIEAAQCIALQCAQHGLPIRARTWRKLTRFLEYPELELSNDTPRLSTNTAATPSANLRTCALRTQLSWTPRQTPSTN